MPGRFQRCLLAFLLLASTSATSETDPSALILGAALAGNGAHEKLAYLTDRIGPRLSGSAGLENAVRWCATELGRDGLDRVWTEPVTVPHWVRGLETGKVIAPIEHPLALTALGMSDPTPEQGITAEVFEATSLEEVRAAGEKIRGKIVLYNRAILPNGVGADGYGAVAELRHKGASEAAKVGAAGVLIRSLGTASFRLPHTGSMTYEKEVPRIPAAAISAEDADLIHRFIASGDPVRVRFTLGCKHLPDATSANVLADLRGSTRRDEIVLIGAHLDSWDLATGAIDDGAGVAIVMETMRVLKALGVRPSRTIRAVLFTNEENGLGGGKAYAAAHAAEVSKHVAAIESDSGGARPLGFGVTAGLGGVEIVREIARHLAMIDAADVEPSGGGADISPLGDKQVPTLSLRQDTTRYFDIHHTAADTLDKVNPRDLAMNVAAMAVMAYALADRPDPLPLPPKKEGSAPRGLDR